MANHSDGSDINLSGNESSFESLSFGDDDSTTSIGSVSDQTYSDISFGDMQEFLDHDLSDDSDLEQDEVALLLEDAIDISPSKRPPAGSRVYFEDEAATDDEVEDNETSPVPLARNLAESFEQVGDDQEPSPPKRSRPTTTSGRSGNSIINDYIQAKEVIWISFDLETGGPYSGIIQLSAVFYNSVHQELASFDSYCRPPATAQFLRQACECHGIYSRDDPKLRRAPPVEKVWRDFCAEVQNVFGSRQDYVGVLVAWNGKSCDMEWVYKLVHASTNNNCDMPPQIEYFMDPYLIIKKFRGCPLHPSKSKLPNLSLSTVYKHVTGQNLANAHNSLFDCRAQGTVIACNDFSKHQNMKASIIKIESVWSAKNKKRLEQEEELKVQPHEAWKMGDEAEKKWEPPLTSQFESAEGGPTPGPTRAVKAALQGCTDAMKGLALLFLFFFDKTRVLDLIVKESDRYAYKDWVKEEDARDTDGRVKKKKILKPCDSNYSSKRHRVLDNVKDQWDFTCGYILAWLGIFIYFGGLSSKQSPDVLWSGLENGGVYAPFVRNTMSKNAFAFVRQYIHFGDNSSQSNDKDDPLYKIRNLLGLLMDQLRRAWNANVDLSVDESMIIYKGRAIRFVQYLPKKPIKHGIKVYCLCDAENGYLLAFEVYTGAEAGSTTWDIIERLIRQSDLGRQRGRRLFMDNFYTTMKVVTKLY